MTSRIPEKPSESEAEGVPDPGYADPSQLAAGDDEATLEPPRDTAVAVDDFGTTAAELAEGESLDGRLDREVPEVLEAVDRPADESAGADTPFDERAGQGVGRLVEPDQGARADTEADLVATDEGTDLGGYSAEESAMHLEPEV
ncbi:MAG: hypothetical protein JWN08_1231 [Frankiales bacterium]|jgi:hypothetical protein|nr:hypothetical protein [Frankiales bacterium]